MRNKGAVVVLTIIVTALSLYYLSFTFVSRNIQKEAVSIATDESGVVDLAKKQEYLDSIWNEPVYSLLGYKYTFKDVKDTELNLGLDLQGGMHVVLEVSPVAIIKGISGNNEDPDFLAAIRMICHHLPSHRNGKPQPPMFSDHSPPSPRVSFYRG